MMKKISPYILFLFFLLIDSDAICQVKFTATITPEKISKTEYAALKLLIENGESVQKITLPVLKNFDIVGGPNQESGTTVINNVVKKYIALTYFIKPHITGKLSIPPATAIIDGKKQASNSTILQVTNNSRSGNSNPNSPFRSIDQFLEEAVPINDNILKKGESAQDKVQKNMFIKVDVDKTSCFVGEPVTVTYKLCTRLKSESVLTKNPSFNGFSIIDMQRTENANYTRETINGKEYNVYIIRKAQLYPLQPGKVEIEKAEVENTIQFIREDYVSRQRQMWDDIFNDFAQATLPSEAIETHKVVLQSKPIFITVNALPETGKPADFKGAVGNFAISAEIEKKNFTTDEQGKLLLQISGEGNLQLITAPGIAWPKKVEGYEPKITNTLNKFSAPVSGKILYEYYFTADSAGNYTIPSVSFSYFNNKTADYKTISTKPVSFKVTDGKKIKNNIIVKEKNDEHFFNTLFTNRWWIVIGVALIIITGLTTWLIKEKRKDKRLKNLSKNSANGVVHTEPIINKNWLEKAEGYLSSNNPSQFYNELNTAFKNYLAYKFNIPASQPDKNFIIDILKKNNIAENIQLEVQKILENIQWQLYTPFPDAHQQQTLFEKVKTIIADINTA